MPRKKKKTPTEPIEIDFHGYRPDDAYEELTQLVDRYQGAKGMEIRVVHGKGAGVLSAEVERFGRNDPRVSSAEKSFFNPGVTTLILNGNTGGGVSASRREWDHFQEPRIRKRKG